MEKNTELRGVKIDKEVLTMVKKSADRAGSAAVGVYFFHLAAAAFLAFSLRCSGDKFASFFLPSASPKLGRCFAAADFAGVD